MNIKFTVLIHCFHSYSWECWGKKHIKKEDEREECKSKERWKYKFYKNGGIHGECKQKITIKSTGVVLTICRPVQKKIRHHSLLLLWNHPDVSIEDTDKLRG